MLSTADGNNVYKLQPFQSCRAGKEKSDFFLSTKYFEKDEVALNKASRWLSASYPTICLSMDEVELMTRDQVGIQ